MVLSLLSMWEVNQHHPHETIRISTFSCRSIQVQYHSGLGMRLITKRLRLYIVHKSPANQSEALALFVLAESGWKQSKAHILIWGKPSVQIVVNLLTSLFSLFYFGWKLFCWTLLSSAIRFLFLNGRAWGGSFSQSRTRCTPIGRSILKCLE